MATVYKIELVSHWINYTPKQIEEAIKKSIEDLSEAGNEVQVRAERKS